MKFLRSFFGKQTKSFKGYKMGLLVNGKWVLQQVPSFPGKLKTPFQKFESKVTLDGSSGHRGDPNRYHLYISLACPWAHSVLMMRALKGLEKSISVTSVHHFLGRDGWQFSNDSPDPQRCAYLHQVYTLAKPDYTGLVSVPALWDKRERTIINNDSDALLLMLNSQFQGPQSTDFYPKSLRGKIEDLHEYLQDAVFDGVFKVGYATDQISYNELISKLFNGLAKVEIILSKSRFLLGEQMTLLDVKLFAILVRFDMVYNRLFKCSQRRIEDYQNISQYLRDIYQMNGIKQTVNFSDIKNHYYRSLQMLNPSRVVPAVPEVDLGGPHDRLRFSKQRVSVFLWCKWIVCFASLRIAQA